MVICLISQNAKYEKLYTLCIMVIIVDDMCADCTVDGDLQAIWGVATTAHW